jgi:hypothetical protein
MTMQRKFLIGIFISIFCFSLSPLSAQPWVKKAAKSVFTVKTFNADGTLLGSANGFYIGSNGESVSNYAPFKGAATAVVIDASGKEMPVTAILGGDETYDVIKFQVDSKKTTPLTVSTSNATTGTNAWMLPYHEMKNAIGGTIRKTETFRDSYEYLTLALSAPDNCAGSPLFNDAGELIGIMQQAWHQDDTLSYAVCARYADSLHISGLSINDPALRAIGIKKALPNELSQALLTLYVAGASLDSIAYDALIEDFIVQYPDAPDGYQYRAQREVDVHQFEKAAHDMEQSIKVAEKKDEAHFTYSKLIFQKEIYMSDTPFDGWSLDKALAEAQEASRINPMAIYRHHEATILYAQKKYSEAYQVYTTLFNSEIRSASIFYEASRCQEMLRDTTAQLSLLDSCIATFNRPYLKEAAPYLFARSQVRANAKRYRDAVNDLNDYESLMQTSVNANFYYLRHQAEIGGRLFQQALNDIDRAIQMEPDNTYYMAERASLQVRVGLLEEAMETAREIIKLDPQSSDGYLFLGLAQCLKGQKAEGVKNLQKAKELGDPQADGLIEKYK